MDKKTWLTVYAVSGGSCSAIGSHLGKLSNSYDSWLLYVLLFSIMIGFNSVGFMLFAKSLNFSTTTFQPMLISTVSCYISSAFIGFVFHGEALTSLWWLGSFFVITGMLVISVNKEKNKKQI